MTKQADAFCRKLLAGILAAGYFQPVFPAGTPALAAAPQPPLLAEQEFDVCTVQPEETVSLSYCTSAAPASRTGAVPAADDHEEQPTVQFWLAKDCNGSRMAYTPSVRYAGCRYYLFYRVFYQSDGELCTDRDFTVHMEALDPDGETVHSADYSTQYTYTGENNNTYYGSYNYISFVCDTPGSYSARLVIDGDISMQTSTGWKIKEKTLSFKTWVSDSPFGGVKNGESFLPGQKFYICHDLYDKETGETVSDTLGGSLFTVNIALLSPGGESYEYSYDSRYFYTPDGEEAESSAATYPASRAARAFTRTETGQWTVQYQMDGSLTTSLISRTFTVSDSAAPPSYQGLEILSTAPLSPEGKFVWGEDNWNFDNTSESFIHGYTYDSDTREAFAALFGFNRIEDVFTRRLEPYTADMDFGGACYGMAVGELLYKNGLLDLSALGMEMEHTPFANGRSDAALSVSDFLYWMQNIPCVAQAERYSRSLGLLDAYPQSEFCRKLEQTVIGDDIAVLIYKIQYADGHTSGHAVFAYGVETGRYYFNGQPYDRRILICDPNYSVGSTPYDKSCLYYNTEDYSWVVPYQTNDQRSLYWNAEDGTAHPHGYIDQIIQFPSMRGCTDRMADEAGQQEQYYSGLHILDDDTVDYKLYTKSGSYTIDTLPAPVTPVYQKSAGLTVLPRPKPLLPEHNAQGGKWSSSHFNLHSALRAYELICDEPCETVTMMDYENVGYIAELHDATNVYYHPDRHIEAQGSNLCYDITMICNDGWNVTDWYSMNIFGIGCDTVCFEMTEDGYLVTTDGHCNLGAFAECDTAKATAFADVDADRCKLIELTPSVIGILADYDMDGEYETVVSPAVRRFGDTDYDGAVTLNDAITALEQYAYQMMGIRELNAIQLQAGDVSGDRILDLTDISYILEYFSSNSLLMEPVTWREVTGNPDAPEE